MIAAGSEPLPQAALRKCILVVEDEVLIRSLVSDELRDEGYVVVEAFNADEALDILKTEICIDLIFSDVRMPGLLDGMDLLAIVRNSRPTLPVVITSGHLEPTIALEKGAAQFVGKPYFTGVIIAVVNSVLAAAE